MMDLELQAHPLFRLLVPVLAAAPTESGHTVRVWFNSGTPTYVEASYLLPAGRGADLYALPWPPELLPAHHALLTALGPTLRTIAQDRAVGALVIVLDALGQPLARPRWQGRLVVRG